MRRADFSELVIKHQYRNKPNPYYYDDLIAYDTETYKGKAYLICDSKGGYVYPNSFEDCLAFLTRKKYRGVIGWFYNINYDIEAIMRWLPEETIREFIKEGELIDFANMFDKVKLRLLDTKMAILTRHKYNFKFYDIGNFYKGGLDKNAKLYLGEQKDQISIDWDNYTLDDLMTTETLKYCQQDARLTERLAQNFVDTCNGFGIFTSNYCSPASLATSYFTAQVDVPTLRDVSNGRRHRLKYAYDSYKGGFIQTFKRGYFEKVWLYDINSAYPYHMSRLPDLRLGRMIYRKKKVPQDAHMGWMKCKVHVPMDELYGPGYYSPLAVYIKKFNKNFYFAGNIEVTITLLEYETLCEDFEIDVIDGYYWIPEKLEYLFKYETEKLYQLRNVHRKDPNLNMLLKTLLNGFYGKLIQKIPNKIGKTEYEFNTGNLFNPFYASYITAGCRIQAYDLINTYGGHLVVGVMTDGVVFSDELEDLGLSGDLGKWDLEFSGEGVFIGSGLYTLRNDKKVKTATRGFKLTSSIDFFNLLAQNLENDVIEMDQKVRLTYREACRVKRFVDWNIIQKGIKNFNINSDSKRIWANDFKNCREVLETTIDSRPFSVNM